MYELPGLGKREQTKCSRNSISINAKMKRNLPQDQSSLAHFILKNRTLSFHFNLIHFTRNVCIHIYTFSQFHNFNHFNSFYEYFALTGQHSTPFRPLKIQFIIEIIMFIIQIVGDNIFYYMIILTTMLFNKDNNNKNGLQL